MVLKYPNLKDLQELNEFKKLLEKNVKPSNNKNLKELSKWKEISDNE